MGIYRWAWRSGMGVLTATGAVFAVLDLPRGGVLALGVCAVILGAVIGAGIRWAVSMSGVLSASAVALLGTFAVAGLLTVLGPAASPEVALLGMLSPRVLRRFPMVVADGAGAAPLPPVCSSLSDEQLCSRWRNTYIALQHTVLPGERLYLVETRAAVVEEFAHRNPEAFPGWLYSAPAASNPPLLRGLPTSPPPRDQQP